MRQNSCYNVGSISEQDDEIPVSDLDEEYDKEKIKGMENEKKRGKKLE